MRQRTPEEAKEYKRLRKYGIILETYRTQNEKCSFCDKSIETLHHIDENHGNNRIKNLLPLCHSCHADLQHKIADNPAYSQEIKEHWHRAIEHRVMAKRQGLTASISHFPTLKGKCGVDKTFPPTSGVWLNWRKPAQTLRIRTDYEISDSLRQILQNRGYKQC